ncbi:hypothetical protein O9992_17680 [Vibrio lentus]|nr:hypothetical protein [Vibrio lentus]
MTSIVGYSWSSKSIETPQSSVQHTEAKGTYLKRLMTMVPHQRRQVFQTIAFRKVNKSKLKTYTEKAYAEKP